MNRIALQMLMGDTAKYFGIVFGVMFASLIMTQQPSIFWGLMSRTYSAISDAAGPDIWVMDQKVQFIDDIKALQDTELFRVRAVEGVAWAVPMYKGLIRIRMDSGSFQNATIIGIDDISMVGAPPIMVSGKLTDLRTADAVILDEDGAKGRLARTGPDGTKIPVKIGDTLEMNDKRAVVVGISKNSRTFQNLPVIYTTYSRAKSFALAERRQLSFVLVKAADGMDLQTLNNRINQVTGLKALTADQFKKITFDYFMKNTGIPINFGIAIVLGFLVGTAVAGQMFFSFAQENIKQFATLKAMGTSNWTLLRMIVLQALVSGVLGWSMGVGLAAWFGWSMRKSILAFRMVPEILMLSATGCFLIMMISAIIAIIKVVRLEPAIVFKG